MQKTFTVAGVSVLNEVLTYRFCNGSAAGRKKILERNGHTEVVLEALPREMTKDEAVQYLRKKGIVAVLPAGRKHKSLEEIDAERKEKAKEARKARKAKGDEGATAESEQTEGEPSVDASTES